MARGKGLLLTGLVLLALGIVGGRASAVGRNIGWHAS